MEEEDDEDGEGGRGGKKREKEENQRRGVTRRNREVVNFTRYRVKKIIPNLPI